MQWFKRELLNKHGVLVWLNILNNDLKVTPDRIKVSGLTVYYYNDIEIGM